MTLLRPTVDATE